MASTAPSVTEMTAALRSVPGIGGKLADRLAAAIRDTGVFADPAKTLTRLSLPGFGPARLGAAAQAIEAWVRSESFRQLRAVLQPAGFGPIEVSRIVAGMRDLGVENPAEAVLANPYDLLLLDWLTWKQVDGFARTRLPAADERRAAGALCAATYSLVRRGHTCVPRGKVVAIAAKLASVDMDHLGRMLNQVAGNDGRLRQERFGERIAVYPRPLFFAERLIAAVAARRLNSGWSADLPEGAGDAGAVLAALRRTGLCAITGPAGTGKTSLVREILRLLGPSREAALLAPTGKAARVLAQRCDHEADTVHHWLGLAPDATHPLLDSGRGTPSDGQAPTLIVVDEASVLDVPLAARLFAQATDSAILLVGDPHQLPPVGPGQPLRDLIRAGLPQVQLTTIYRQRTGGLVLENAHRVLAAGESGGPLELRAGSAFDIHPAATGAEVQRLAVERAVALGPEVQVLTAQKAGIGGLHALNADLRSHWNAGAGAAAFHPGDRVICTRNSRVHGTDPDGRLVGLYNGMGGEVVAAGDGDVEVRFDGPVPVRGEFQPDEAEDMLELAWALTVHRAQGSEWPGVILAIPPEHSAMWTWQLLYTAITRAREHVCLVGDLDVIRGVGARSSVDREGHIVDRIRAALHQDRRAAPLRTDF